MLQGRKQAEGDAPRGFFRMLLQDERWYFIALRMVVMTYLILMTAMFILQRRFTFPGQVLPPVTISESEQRAGIRPVTLPMADGLEITAYMLPPLADDRPVIFLAHGNGETPESWFTRALMLNRQYGWGMLILGYRGYGGNPGKPSEKAISADARVFQRWLQQQYPRNPHVYYGQSLGTGVMTMLASEPTRIPPRMLVLETPYTSLPDVGQTHWPWLPVKLLMWDRFPSLERIRHLKVPLIVMHGGRDRTIPQSQGRALFNAVPPQLRYRGIWPEDGQHSNLHVSKTNTSDLWGSIMRGLNPEIEAHDQRQ